MIWIGCRAAAVSGTWFPATCWDGYEEPDDGTVFIPGKLKSPIPAAVRIAILRTWNENESFDPGRPELLALLMTRRVLEWPAARYRVHPALASVLY